MELPADYNGENMLIGANNLNNEIRQYLDSISSDANVREDTLHTLEEYILDIDEYITDISAYEFAPRSDDLTKEGILADLNANLQQINQTISNMQQTAGKKRQRKNKRKSRKSHSRKSRSKKLRSKKSLKRRH
jgi:hypothetical protein